MSEIKEPLNDDAYKVGYQRPPLHSRFKTGNQAARRRKSPPAGDADLSTVADRLLRKQVAITIDGRRQRMALGEALIQKLLADAARGDHRARAHVFKLEELRLRLAASADPSAEAQDQPLDETQQDIVERFKADLREQVRRENASMPPTTVAEPVKATTPSAYAPVRVRRRLQ